MADTVVKTDQSNPWGEGFTIEEGPEEWLAYYHPERPNVLNHWGEQTHPDGDEIWVGCAEGAD